MQKEKAEKSLLAHDSTVTVKKDGMIGLRIQFQHPKDGKPSHRLFLLTTEQTEELAANLLDAVIQQRNSKK